MTGVSGNFTEYQGQINECGDPVTCMEKNIVGLPTDQNERPNDCDTL